MKLKWPKINCLNLICKLFCIVTVWVFSVPVYVQANSGPVYWQGYPAGDIISVQKDSPLKIEKENILFDFSSSDELHYTFHADVAAVYQMLNPTNELQTVQMAFPFVGSPDYISQDRIQIFADGLPLSYDVYFGERVNVVGSSSQKNKKQALDFASVLQNLQINSYKPENFSYQEKGKLYTYKIYPVSDKRLNVLFEFNLERGKTRILTSGFERYSYERETGDRIIGTRVQEEETVEILVLGDDVEFEINAYTGDSSEPSNNLFTYDLEVQQVEVKPYLLKYMGNYERSDLERYREELFKLYAEALDKGFQQNDVCSSEVIFEGITDSDRIITLVYEVNFPPGSTKEIEVNYEVRGSMDRTRTIKPLYTFVYLLNPAKSWSSFKNLNIEIRTPEKAPYVVDSTIELQKKQPQIYTASLAELPEQDFVFKLYEAEKITMLDKIQGRLNNMFGYFTPLLLGIAITVVFIIAAIAIRKFLIKSNP